MPEVQSTQSVDLANTHPHGDIVGDVERIASHLPLDEFYIGDISAGQVGDYADHDVIQSVTVKTARDRAHRREGKVEMKIGPHSYVVDAEALCRALTCIRDGDIH